MFSNRRRRVVWFRWSLTSKLFFSYAAVLAALAMIFSLSYGVIVLKRVRVIAAEQSERAAVTLSSALIEEGRDESRSTLRSHAESAARVAQQIHRSLRAGELESGEAKRRAIDYLRETTIGNEGYFYVVNSEGDVIYHPSSDLIGTNQQEYEFVRRQTVRKNGFFTYSWDNAGDSEPRKKLAYMAYFPSWDWIITATDYEEGLLNRVPSEGIEKLLDSYELSSGGAAYVFGGNGALLFDSFRGNRWSRIAARQVTPGEPGVALLHHEPGRSLTYLAWHPLPGYDASAAIVYSGDHLTQAFAIYLPYLAASIAASLLLLLFLSKLMAEMVTAPIKRITARFVSQTEKEAVGEVSGTDDLTHLVLRLLRTSVRLEYERQQRAEAQNRLAYMASHDALTGLPNRASLGDSLNQTVQACRRRGLRAAVLFLDIDNFKDINDSYGHPVGDGLLRQVAATLKEGLRGEDLVARFGGDEFVMVLPFIEDEMQVVDVVRRLMTTIRRPLRIENRSLRPAASIGVAIYPDNGEEPGELLQNADAAMYEAKRSGRATYRFHDPEMNQIARSRLALLDDVRRALHTGEFELYWQPIVAAGSLELVRAEALLRWNREGTLVEPGDFLPLVENSPIAGELGQWVARTTARSVSALHSQLPTDFSVSINVAPSEIVVNRFVERLVENLGEQEESAGRIHVEITESAAIHDIETAKEVLTGLRAAGIPVHLDDFGEGYASLRYLREFGFDAVKLDRSFLREVPDSPRACSLVRGFVELAHGMGLEVTIEGVETAEQLTFLRELGADYLQGYFIGRPTPVGTFIQHYRSGYTIPLLSPKGTT
ncbi:MAG: EAL domain-containing protein [Spirochaetaceae bacterium]